MTSLSALLLAAVLALAAVLLFRSRATQQVTSADVTWLVGAGPGSPVPHEEAEVAARYLARHRHYRLVGGLIGVGFAVVVGLRWYRSVGFGFAQRSPLADVLFCGVAGVLVGALLSESYRLRPTLGARTASLAPHPPAPHAEVVIAARLVLAAASVAGLVMAWTGAGPAALASAVAGGLVVAVAELTRRRIVDRRRPVHTGRVERLDRQLRAFAATSVARLQLAAAILTAMWVLAWWQAATPAAPVALDILAGAGGLAGLAVVVVLLLQAAPRAPRRARSST